MLLMSDFVLINKYFSQKNNKRILYLHKEEKIFNKSVLLGRKVLYMLEFIVNTIFWTFTIYGIYEFIKNIIYLSTYTNMKADGIYVIIAVKNQEEKIEGFLRSILFKILYGREEYLKNIIVADLESSDNTKEISKKLAKDYEILKVTSWKECKEIMDSINDLKK